MVFNIEQKIMEFLLNCNTKLLKLVIRFNDKLDDNIISQLSKYISNNIKFVLIEYSYRKTIITKDSVKTNDKIIKFE